MKSCIISGYPGIKKGGSTAAIKAPWDIEEICGSIGTKRLYTVTIDKKYWRNLQVLKKLFVNRIATANKVAIIQYPHQTYKPVTMEKIISIPKVKIGLVHDLDSFRFAGQNGSMKQKKEIEVLNQFNALIVHNKRMRMLLEENGVCVPMVELQLFDYLTDCAVLNRVREEEGTYSIAFAGNINKSAFIKNISDYIKKTKVMLYGITNEEITGNNVEYMGVFPPEQLVSEIKGDFGLIWDGIRCESCDGNVGKYLKINNPHKLSLYVASGLPVITWREAAISDFILEHNIGFVVDSLAEIDGILSTMTAETYNQYCENVKVLSYKVREGFFTKEAVKKAFSKVRE